MGPYDGQTLCSRFLLPGPDVNPWKSGWLFLGYCIVAATNGFVFAWNLLGFPLPRPNGIPFIAAALFIVNPSEPVRFLLTGMCYYGSVFLLVCGVWLHLLSHHRRNRFLLILSCVFVGASLLQYETAFPLTLLVPILVLVQGYRNHTMFWIATWLASVGLLAVRFVHHLLFDAEIYREFLLPNATTPHTMAAWCSVVRNIWSSSLWSPFLNSSGRLRPFGNIGAMAYWRPLSLPPACGLLLERLIAVNFAGPI